MGHPCWPFWAMFRYLGAHRAVCVHRFLLNCRSHSKHGCESVCWLSGSLWFLLRKEMAHQSGWSLQPFLSGLSCQLGYICNTWTPIPHQDLLLVWRTSAFFNNSGKDVVCFFFGPSCQGTQQDSALLSACLTNPECA